MMTEEEYLRSWYAYFKVNSSRIYPSHLNKYDYNLWEELGSFYHYRFRVEGLSPRVSSIRCKFKRERVITPKEGRKGYKPILPPYPLEIMIKAKWHQWVPTPDSEADYKMIVWNIEGELEWMMVPYDLPDWEDIRKGRVGTYWGY